MEGGGGGGGGYGRVDLDAAKDIVRRLAEGGAGFQSRVRSFSPVGRARAGGRGVEVPVPGVVNDCDYRLCLSTGIKFADTHMATVLDFSRVLVDEIVVGEGFSGGGVGGDGDYGGGRGGGGSVGSVFLSL